MHPELCGLPLQHTLVPPSPVVGQHQPAEQYTCPVGHDCAAAGPATRSSPNIPRAVTIVRTLLTVPHFAPKTRRPAVEMMAFNMMMASDELTTARVVAQPTPSLPPNVERPQ